MHIFRINSVYSLSRVHILGLIYARAKSHLIFPSRARGSIPVEVVTILTW